ncbi:MAG: CaiB/BaiF CoA transferase family protein [Sandaracinaceae bacterium]
MNDAADPRGPLDGVKVLDLSRILAGPSCTQVLGDLGADVIKVERPSTGDDTRSWGPPFVEAQDGSQLEAAYYLAANRNKRSVEVDLTDPSAVEKLRRLAETSDVLVHNFKVGGLEKYGLEYAQLEARCPRLVYCAISGFGQTGPRADQAGYDFLIQAMGGIMSLTGPPEGEPFKVGVGVSDVVTGLYATVGILAALRHRDRTGEGQLVDVALFDAQLAWLVNAAAAYLESGRPPARRGNAHPHIVPYQAFAAADGSVALAIGNDGQFRRFCALAELPFADDPRFATNAARVENRTALVPPLAARIAASPVAFWEAGCRARGVPCGPVNDLAAALGDPQVAARGMRIRMDRPDTARGYVELVGSPLKLGRTPVTYRRPPPRLGEHTDEVLT